MPKPKKDPATGANAVAVKQDATEARRRCFGNVPKMISKRKPHVIVRNMQNLGGLFFFKGLVIN